MSEFRCQLGASAWYKAHGESRCAVQCASCAIYDRQHDRQEPPVVIEFRAEDHASGRLRAAAARLRDVTRRR